jgi:hypothetical protein
MWGEVFRATLRERRYASLGFVPLAEPDGDVLLDRKLPLR